MTSRNLIIAALTLMLVAAVAAAQEATVEVRGEVTVSGPALTLGDVAAVETADAALAAALRDIRLGVSPMPGNWRELDREMIRAQLRRSGYSSSRVQLLCPALVKIYRNSQTVSQAEIEQHLRDYIAAGAPWSPDEMQVTEVSRIGDTVLPAGALSIEIQPRGGASWLGATPFVIDLTVDGQVARQLVMQARISVFRLAAVMTNAVPARRVIGPGDVELRRVDIAAASGTAFESLDRVIGMEAVTYLQPGQIVTVRNVAPPVLVKRGQAIALEARSNQFVIRTVGLAQQDGRRGEVIRVVNPASKKTVEARVTGEGTAEVIY
jgi:flagellar basal body P-ring formation protein FlgA